MRIAVVGKLDFLYARGFSSVGHCVELCDPKPSIPALGFADETGAPLRGVCAHSFHTCDPTHEGVEEAERQLRNALPVDVLPGFGQRFARTARYISNNHIGNPNPTAAGGAFLALCQR